MTYNKQKQRRQATSNTNTAVSPLGNQCQLFQESFQATIQDRKGDRHCALPVWRLQVLLENRETDHCVRFWPDDNMERKRPAVFNAKNHLQQYFQLCEFAAHSHWHSRRRSECTKNLNKTQERRILLYNAKKKQQRMFWNTNKAVQASAKYKQLEIFYLYLPE